MAGWRRRFAGIVAGIVLAIVGADAHAQGRPGAGPWLDSAATDEEAAAAARAAVPFTPEQIRIIGEIVREAQRASAKASGPPPIPGMRAIRLSLEATAPPPRIHTRKGYATALVFLDLTGRPWPVVETLADAEFLADRGEGGETPKERGHVVYLAPARPFLAGNALVSLAGLDTPVALTLSEGGEVADYRVEIRLPLRGPNADPLQLAQPARLEVRDPYAAFFVDGAPPLDAIELVLEPVRIGERAWLLEGRIYLRTPAPLLSPAAEAMERTASGDYVYAIPDVPFALLAAGADGTRRVALHRRDAGAGNGS